VVAAAPFALAAEPATQESERVPTEVRTYNIADLLHREDAQDVEKLAPGGYVTTEARVIASAIDTDALLKLVYTLVDSESWQENGGSIGQVVVLGPMLVIRQTRENHDAISKLLAQVRHEQGPVQMMNVQAYWLRMDETEVKQIFDTASKNPAGAALPVVPDELVNDVHIYCQAGATCFSGQPIRFTSGREQTYVSDVTPIVGTDSVGYDPQPGMAISGVTLGLMPQLGADGEVVLKLSSVVSEVDARTQIFVSMDAPRATTQPVAGGGTAAIDRLNTLKQEFRSSVRMPLGKKVLIGGMTLDPASKNTGGPRQLYLVVQADVVR
jgi:hypothetical protein